MCGIVGYIGKKQATSILIEGLRRLEYRGYDSAGIAVLDGGRITTSKALGQVKFLAEQPSLLGTLGIGHTRWATHGDVTLQNTHPHADSHGRITVVPLQLLAYEVARLLGKDIDRPRNLAKSVTVE